MRLRSLVGALAATTALVAPGAAQAAGYAAHFSEVLTTGAAGAHPDVTLTATFDDGSGGQAAPTGQIVFSIDNNHLDPLAVPTLATAPVGTALGYATTDLTGGPGAHLPITIAGPPGATGLPIAIAVPANYVPIVGPSIPGTIAPGSRLTIAVNLQTVNAKLVAAGLSLAFGQVNLTFFGQVGGANVITNRSTTTALTNSLSAQPCANANCSSLLGPASTDSGTLTLPHVVTLTAPSKATYGQAAHFTGSALSGDGVQLWQSTAAGLVKLTGATGTAGSSGAFSATARLRSQFDSKHKLSLPATGTYAVTASADGKAMVLATAAKSTTVSLAKPKVTAKRHGGKVKVTVAESGGDQNVAVKVGTKGGKLGLGGRFTTTIKLKKHGKLTVKVSVAGALSASSTITVK